MDLFHNATELIKGRLFFISLTIQEHPKSTGNTHYFNIDEELCYESFHNDFGPLNISVLYHYCNKVNRKLSSTALQKKRIVHYTCLGPEKRVNAAFLAYSYMIIYRNYTADRVKALLLKNLSEPFIDFRDASVGTPSTISLYDCLSAIYKAHRLGMFNFDDFDFMEYEHYEQVENGDLNWIVPGKFIGFVGPQNQAIVDNGYPSHSPEKYFSYFRRHNVKTIIRLNKKMYDASKFTKAGFEHKDLYFVDGSTPSDKILNTFLSTCEETDGAVAVHCKAGLGRTGSLIGSYIMKHYKFTANETIAWVRICRPGSIIGHQQAWLQRKESMLWEAGDEYRATHMTSGPPNHLKGIYSCSPGDNVTKKPVKRNGDVGAILHKVDTIQLEDQDSDSDEEENLVVENLTQGDHLKRIKSQRRTQPFPIKERKTSRTCTRMVSLENLSVLRGGKVLGRGIKNQSSSSSRVLTKRVVKKQRRPCLHKTAGTKTPTRTPSAAAIVKKRQSKVMKKTSERASARKNEILRCKLNLPRCINVKVVSVEEQTSELENKKISVPVKFTRRYMPTTTETKNK